MWTYAEAGPFQPEPCAGQSWQEEGQPLRQAPEYLRQGTATRLCLFHPVDGQVRAKGVTRCPNPVLHTWLKEELTAVLATLPPAPEREGPIKRGLWQRWQEGLQRPITLAAERPPLRALLGRDNLAGHRTPEFVLWLFAHGIMPL